MNKSDFDKPLFGDVTKGRLILSKVKEVINLIEAVRARNLASRQDALITEFSQAGHNNKVELNLQFCRYLTQELPSGKRIVYIPTIGIPQSINCHNSQRLIEKIEDKEIDSIHLIYDDMSIRNSWLNHLEWLNKRLEIQTIKKQEFNTWFQNF